MPVEPIWRRRVAGYAVQHENRAGPGRETASNRANAAEPDDIEGKFAKQLPSVDH
jgi:hypothetical protein